MGRHAVLFVRIRRFFVRHAFVFKNAVRELFLPKSFVRETIKFSSCSCCLAKIGHFLDSSSKKILVFVLLCKTKNLRIRVCKNCKQQNLRVRVLKKMCTDKKSSYSWFSANKKSSQKGRNLRVRNFLVSSKL